MQDQEDLKDPAVELEYWDQEDLKEVQDLLDLDHKVLQDHKVMTDQDPLVMVLTDLS